MQRGLSAKLNAAQVAEIRARYAAGGVTQKELGREFGVNQTQISNVVRGQAWTNRLLISAA